jgi:hypothetical protein
MRNKQPAKNWAQFDRRIRNKDTRLLARLSDFPDALLVAGCQRSGTTVVTRILREAVQMTSAPITRDDELDAALILAGAVPFETDSRSCFQTTYVNDHYREYFDHDNYRLIWIIRRPEAVVRSMLFNWRRGALNRLFRACGQHALDSAGKKRFERFGTFGFSRLEMACLSYNIKSLQLHDIAIRLGSDRLYIVDYDDLIDRSEILLPDMFSFMSIPYDARLLQRLRKPGEAARERLTAAMRSRIRETSEHTYQQAVDLANNWR